MREGKTTFSGKVQTKVIRGKGKERWYKRILNRIRRFFKWT